MRTIPADEAADLLVRASRVSSYIEAVLHSDDPPPGWSDASANASVLLSKLARFIAGPVAIENSKIETPETV